MHDRPTVLLADDHVLVAEGIQKLLAAEFNLIRIVPDGRALLTSIQECSPDVAIVDISLPLLNGLEASRHIRTIDPNIKIVILTMHSESSFVTEAFRIGVSGYVLKQSVGSELILALRVVLTNNTYVSPMLAQGLADRAVHPTVADNTGAIEGFAQELSTRQREVLQLVAEGKTNKEIAVVLELSVKTVEFHKGRIMKQLGIRTAVDLTKYAISNGLISIH